MLSGATEEQYGNIGRHRLAEMEEMDAYIETVSYTHLDVYKRQDRETYSVSSLTVNVAL